MPLFEAIDFYNVGCVTDLLRSTECQLRNSAPYLCWHLQLYVNCLFFFCKLPEKLFKTLVYRVVYKIYDWLNGLSALSILSIEKEMVGCKY